MKTFTNASKRIEVLRLLLSSYLSLSFKQNFLPRIFLLVCLATACNFALAQSNTYTYYFDGDGDGYGKTNSPLTSSDPTPPPGYAKFSGDCNDGDASVNPGKPEICGDGIDNNCDGQIDEGCSVTYTYYFDGDGDGYGKTNSPLTSSDPTPPPGYAKFSGDCNDGDASVNPGKPEICGDGIDNNCDGQIDEGCSVTYTYYFDGDGDGYGKTNSPLTSSDPTPPTGYAKFSGDCNDGDASVNPGKPEICGDGIDNNCDGQIDEGCSVTYTYYFDGDGDGYGKTNSPLTSNDPTPPPGYAKFSGDCNDGNPAVNPGKPEICGDGIDNNCDGQIDEGCSVTYTYYFDGDGDGYGKTNSPLTSNDPTPPPDYAKFSGDCNDGNPAVNPGKPEICGDGIDNNCDGQIDEGCSVTYTYYFDGDGDGYGKTNSPLTSNDPTPPPGYAKFSGDCNDGNPAVNPGKPEICGDGIDNNCDGQIDEGCSVTYTYYFDGDGDGYGKTNSPLTSNDPTPPPGYAKFSGDCNDGNPAVNPGKPEICGDGIDNNCDGQIDEGCSVTYTYYFDGDGDGYGKTNSPLTNSDPTPPPGYAKFDGDCNDGNATVHPGATEICGDGIDNNCNGQIDEGCSVTYTYYFDGDGDGYGKTNSPLTSNSPTPPPGYAKLDGDCNDGNATVHPGATEICGDGIDNNCDGQIDEDCGVTYTYYGDFDNDGYGKTGNSITSNSPTPPPGYSAVGGDCNDGDPSVNPGKPEICGDGIDNNCNGQIDEGCSVTYTYYFDGDGDGYGKTNSPLTSSNPTPPPGYAKFDGDCNDGDPSVNPGAPEICGDGIDNNCNGQIDEGCSVIVLTAGKTAASSCGTDGTITLIKTGGTAPFTYSLDGVHYQTGNKFTGLAAGTYTGFVKDSKNHLGTLSGITITKAATVVVWALKTAAGFCADDGTITITKTGGIAPFTYSIDGVNFVTSNKFTGLGAGTYTAYVKDARCPAASVEGIVITKPAALVVSATSTIASACANDGIVTITKTGGTAPFTYSIDGVNFVTSNKFTGLGAGTYTAYVKDARCPAVSLLGVVVDKTAPIVISVKKTAASFCANDGTIVIAKTGGTAPFTYSLDGINFVTSNKFTGLAAGTYTTWVKDARCPAVSLPGIVITKAPLVVKATKTDATACYDDGTITLTRTGGTAPFTYSLDGVNFVTTNVFTGLAAGTYTGWVKDSKCPVVSLSGITISTTVCNSISSSASTSTGGENSSLKIMNASVVIFPNPVNDLLHVELRGYIGKVTLQLTNMEGKALMEKKFEVQSADVQEQLNAATFTSGVYLLTAIDEKGNRQTEKLVIAH